MKVARKTFKVEVPSVAMGDIAFNLLIFFVILARAQDDSRLKWEPASTPYQMEKADGARARLVIDVNNKLYLNGGEVSAADVSRLAKEIEKLLGDAPAGKRAVVLKIHKATLAQRFEPIIEAVSEAGGELIHVLEEKREK
jgi:biopolymer transport protein ExbD